MEQNEALSHGHRTRDEARCQKKRVEFKRKNRPKSNVTNDMSTPTVIYQI